jgi:hypothetical protein
VVPVLPVYVRSFGVGNAEVGAVVSAFALMRFVSSPFCGRLIDWAGERAILSIGIGIVALSSGLVGVAQNYPQLLILRGIGGIGSAMFTVSAMTLLIGSTSTSMRARSIGFYQGGFLIGGMTGPALGGLLATISLTAPFFFYAATLAVAGIVGILLLRPRTIAAPNDTGGTQVSVPFREVLRDRGFRAACLANFAQGWTSFGVRNSLVPVLIVEVLRGPSTWTGSGTIHRHCWSQARHRRFVRGGGCHNRRRPLRDEFLGAHRPALPLRCGGGIHGHGTGRSGRGCRRRAGWPSGGAVLDVLRLRCDHRAPRRGFSRRHRVLPGGFRGGRGFLRRGVRLRPADARTIAPSRRGLNSRGYPSLDCVSRAFRHPPISRGGASRGRLGAWNIRNSDTVASRSRRSPSVA